MNIKRYSTLTLAVSTILCMSSYSESQTIPQVGLVKKNGRQISIIGRLDDHVAADFVNLVKPGDDVIINSQGGDNVAAMKIGKAVFIARSKIKVDGLCLSACASYVLPASPDIYITDRSLVALHQTSTALYNRLLNSDYSGAAKYYQGVSRLELAYISEIGVSSNILTVPLDKIGPVCYQTVYKGSRAITGVRTQRAFYIPDKLVYQSWTHHRIGGYWPGNKDLLARALSYALPPEYRSGFILDNSQVSSKDSTTHVTPALAGCRESSS